MFLIISGVWHETGAGCTEAAGDDSGNRKGNGTAVSQDERFLMWGDRLWHRQSRTFDEGRSFVRGDRLFVCEFPRDRLRGIEGYPPPMPFCLSPSLQ